MIQCDSFEAAKIHPDFMKAALTIYKTGIEKPTQPMEEVQAPVAW